MEGLDKEQDIFGKVSAYSKTCTITYITD